MTKVFGHRGAAGTHPENTMCSFVEALRARADGIELDVQLTKDGEIVIIHDETVDRTTNGKGWVKDFTYGEIKKLDAGSFFSAKFRGERIPLLDEVLSWATSNDLLINIELKNNLIDYEGLEEAVITLIKQHHLEERIILSSFNHNSVALCRDIAPEIERAILFMDRLYMPWQYAEQVGAKGIHPYWMVVRDDMITQSKANLKHLRPFTVNGQMEIERFMAQRIDSIITDFPEAAVQIRGKLL